MKINGRFVIIADGLKNPKEGRKMPAVKSLHQQSQANKKSCFIMGHHFECFALLIGHIENYFAVPLVSAISEGVLFRVSETKRSLLDKCADMLAKVLHGYRYYLVADAYYSARKLMVFLAERGNHLVTKMRSNSVAWQEAKVKKKKKRGRGRPRKYGRKVILKNAFKQEKYFISALSPVYGEKGIQISYRIMDLIIRPFAVPVRIVLVKHPQRGRIILLSTDRSLDALDIIRLYGYRFKIEVSFKQAIYTTGTYAYHFWMASMTKIKRKDGSQHVYKCSEEYRKQVKRKLDAYHRYVQLGLITQGLLIYLAVKFRKTVWDEYKGWMRTMNTEKPPSEWVVSEALRMSFWDFLWNSPKDQIWRKFFTRNLDYKRLYVYKKTA